MRTLRYAVLALAAASAAASATVYSPPPQQAAIYEAYNASISDYLYTTSASEAAGTPGYVNNGVFMYIERYPQAGSVAMRRYWKGPPQNDHIYLTDDYPNEISYVLGNGYVDQGVVGYVYPTAQPGSSTAYRMNYNFGNGDLMHRFVLTDAQRLNLIQQGWGYDHELGHRPGTGVRVLSNGAFLYGYPALTGGAVVTRRCNAANTPNFCSGQGVPEATSRDNFWGYRNVATSKPAGTNVQRLQFDLWTPDFFGGSNEHVVIGLHGGMFLNENLVEKSWFEGQAVILGATQCGDARAQIELFWRTPGGVNEYNGHNVQTCPTLASNLQNNQRYRVVILAGDAGRVKYTISILNANGSVGAKVIEQDYMTAQHFPSGVPTTTSYFIATSTSANRDFSLYLSNLAASWQNGGF